MKPKLNTKIEEQGFMERKIGRTFFRRIGQGRGTPLFILHGGPGSTHETFGEILDLAHDRQVILYDQIGCGRSDRLKKKDWTLETFVRELDDLRKLLGFKKIDLLGHSWGGMLAAEYYFTHGKHVRSIVYASPCLDAKAWSDDALELIKQLSPKHQKAIHKSLKTKKYDSKDLKDATEAYYKKFVRRNVADGHHLGKLAGAGFNLEGYLHMWGPAEYVASGTLKNFNRAKDLPKTKVPTLFTCGLYDEATPRTIEKHAKMTPGSKFKVFKKSSHLATLEEPKKYIKTVRQFLKSVD